MTRPPVYRCPDCRRPLVLDGGAYCCTRCGICWTPSAIKGQGKEAPRE